MTENDQRRHVVRVAVVDDDRAVGESVACALMLEERFEARCFELDASVDVVLGRLLSWRADIVLLDVTVGRTWTGAALASPLQRCGIQVAVMTKDVPRVEVVELIRDRLPRLRGRPAPPTGLLDIA